MVGALVDPQLDAALDLNNAHAVETSCLTRTELAEMAQGAFLALQAGAGRDALLLTFAQSAAYDSPNFQWFCARYPTFVYVDRIIVAEHARGRGLARQLYEQLFHAAAAAQFPVIACEINVMPPNPGSDAFHDALGFAEVGRAELAERSKAVRYMTKPLDHLR